MACLHTCPPPAHVKALSKNRDFPVSGLSGTGQGTSTWIPQVGRIMPFLMFWSVFGPSKGSRVVPRRSYP